MKKRRRTDDEQLFEDKEKNKKREQLFFTFTREMQTHSRLVGFDLSFFFLRVRCSRVLISFFIDSVRRRINQYFSDSLSNSFMCLIFKRKQKRREHKRNTQKKKGKRLSGIICIHRATDEENISFFFHCNITQER